MPEFRIRLEFDVEVDDPSYIDAAFAAADWLQDRANESRFSYLTYEVASHTDLRGGHGTQFVDVDLEQVQSVDYTPDDEPCRLAGVHLRTQRHGKHDCPVNEGG